MQPHLQGFFLPFFQRWQVQLSHHKYFVNLGQGCGKGKHDGIWQEAAMTLHDLPRVLLYLLLSWQIQAIAAGAPPASNKACLMQALQCDDNSFITHGASEHPDM